jgi:ribosome-associated translation inhibitor RaiA
MVSGLKGGDKVFQASIQEEAKAFLEKAEKLLSDVEGVTIHVKSSGRGKTEKFELHSLLSLPRTTLYAEASGRKLNFVLQDLFDEMLIEARKHKSLKDSGKKEKKKRFFLEMEVERE